MHWLALVLIVTAISENHIDACSLTDVECDSIKQCIPQEWQCDGIADCIDRSDEANCNPCQSKPCQNDGICSNHIKDYACTCTSEYKGKNCEIDSCSSSPCQHGGNCTVTGADYFCSCKTKYTGNNCETELDDCYSHPCSNGGTCYFTLRGYRCKCLTEYSGTECQISSCSSNPCQHGGSCTVTGAEYLCSCRAKYTGNNCETELNDCYSTPCRNGGTCYITLRGYTCKCRPGYSGRTCAINPPMREMPVSLRLKEGPNPYSGRVLIRLNRQWGTICMDNFDAKDATVICRMLGFTSPGHVLPGMKRLGSGKIWLNNLRCLGNESSVLECPRSLLDTHNCISQKDAAISCKNDAEYIRLQDGAYSFIGRLEVMINGIWGTVCNDGFNTVAATIVCRELGYNGTATLIREVSHHGIGPILLDDVVCGGTELSLLDCGHNEIGQHNCDHTKDAHVLCTTAEHIDVRLQDGPDTLIGRVEVKINGIWGTVRNIAAARVACRMLGYNTSIALYHHKVPNSVNRIIWLDDVECDGTESSLMNCRHNEFSRYNSNLNEYVHVSCMNIIEEVRLRGGFYNFTGRLEIKIRGIWGTIFYHDHGPPLAKVVCRMLGYNNSGRYISGETYPGNGIVWHLIVKCNGTETSLMDCRRYGYYFYNSSGYNAHISCIDSFEGIRLWGGVFNGTGRVEVKINGVWGTVRRHRSNNEAAVVCRMLGFSGTSMYISEELYIATDRPVWFWNLRCRGNETSVMDCSNDLRGKHYPYRESGAMHVSCVDYVEDIRLRGATRSEGRVEVKLRGKWGTICSDNFGSTEAAAVCRMLGSNGPATVSNRKYSGAPSHIWLDDLLCTGTESSILDCDHRSLGIHNCNHSQDVTVWCMDGLPACASGPCHFGGLCTNGLDNYTCVCPAQHPGPNCRNIRLSGGTEGRVEIYIRGEWGCVCDDHFDDRDARVVCRMLDFSTGVALSQRISGGSSRIWLDNVGCTGIESSILDCPHAGIGVEDCLDYERIVVRCS